MLKSKKRKLVTLPKLVKRADNAFSKYIRLRDCEYRNGSWVGECITCNRPLTVIDVDGSWNAGTHCGHYVSRGAKVVRWSEENCSLQCVWCNLWRDKVSMVDAYRKAVDDKFGKGTAARLRREGKKTHKPTREELEEIIGDSKTYVEYTLSHEKEK